MSQQAQEKYEESQLYKIRHSAAHVMAQAVLEMFPDAKYTIGPPVENGFYYDFDLPRNLTPEDLEQIEKRMRQIVQGKHEFKKTVISAEEAKKIFADQPYKLELIEASKRAASMNMAIRSKRSRIFPSTSTTRSRICAADLTCKARKRSSRMRSS